MRTPAALLLAASMVLCASCTVPSVGATGVGVDAHGALVGYLYVCGKHIDGVSLYTAEDEPADEAEVGTWTSSEPLQGAAQWRLDSSPTWDDAGDDVALVEDQAYVMYGWTTDNSASTDHVSFTRTELDELRAGQVRWGDPGKVRTLQEFAAQAYQNS